MVYAYGGSIASNPRTSLIDITQQGTDFLWAVFAIMMVSGIGVLGWGHMLPTGRRAFHYMASVVLFTATVAYFCMASDLGSTPIDVEFIRDQPHLYTGTETPVTRSIWYVRYIDWTITTPMLLLTLLLGTGLPLSDIMFTIFMDLVMIVTGLVGSLVASQYKWGLYAFGCAAMLWVFWVLIGPARTSAFALSPDAGRAYTASSFVLAGLWFLYPIAWGLADGGNVISTDGEMVFYGVLDVLAKPAFTIFHLFALSRVDYSTFQLSSGKYSTGVLEEGITGREGVMNEKAAYHNGAGAPAPVAGAAPMTAGTAVHNDTTAAPVHDTGAHPNAAALHSENPEAFHQTQAPAGVVSQTTV